MAWEKEKLGLYNHCFLDMDGTRAHLRLTGKITILTVFVEYKNAMWDTASQDKYMDACKQACQGIQHDAVGRGIPLELSQCYFKMTLPKDCEIDAAKPITWGHHLLKGFRCKDLPSMARFYQLYFQCDQVMIMIAFNLKGRSLVSLSSEYSFLKSAIAVVLAGQNKYLSATIAHEFLHLFGARDMYYPEDVKAAAEKFMKNSIMLTKKTELFIDDLTAYLIGWRNTLSDDAYFMLNEIRHITPQMLHE